MAKRRWLTDRAIGVWGLVLTAISIVAATAIGIAQLRSTNDLTAKASDEDSNQIAVGPSEPAPAESALRPGWGPSGPGRPILDWNVAEDRNGFLDGPHFNSFTNTPTYGQEMSFLDLRRDNDEAPGAHQNEFINAAGVYQLRAYIENGANDYLDPAVGEAVGTRVRVLILPGIANGFDITGFISADNAIPPQIHDVATLRNEHQPFDLEYVPGSARIFNNAHPKGLVLDDEIVDDGVLIGYETMDGRMPAGYKYSAIVTLKIQIVPA